MTITALAALLACAVLADGPETHRFPIDAIVADSHDPGELHPLESFLRERLPRAVPETGKIVFVHTTRRRFAPGAAAPSATTVHEMEVEARPGFDPEAVRTYLSRLAERSATTLRVHCTVVESARTGPAASQPLRAEVVLLGDHEWRRQRTEAERAEREGEVAVNVSERDVRSGENALLSTERTVSYVADFELTQTGETVIADPVIGVVGEGILVAATPILQPDGATLTLDVVVTIADLVEPMKSIGADLGVGAPVTIQVPEVRQVRWESGPLDLPLESAQFVVRGLFSPADGAPGRVVDVYLRIRPLEAEKSPPRGSVRILDASSGFILVSSREPLREGDRLDVLRGGVPVGTLEVVRSVAELRVAVCRLASGERPREGDEVR